MIIDEKELINLLNYMEVFNDGENVKNMKMSFINANVQLSKYESEDFTNSPVNQIKEKYTENNNLNIIYPFNHIFEFIMLSEEYHRLVGQKNRIMEDIDKVRIYFI